MQKIIDALNSVESVRNEFQDDKKVQDAAFALQIILAENLRNELTTRRDSVSFLNGLTATEIGLLNYGQNKIPAIKALRTRLNCGLKEAKDLVEDFMEKMYGYRYHNQGNS